MNKLNAEDFEKITLRLRASSRGGGIEIDLTTLGFPGEMMTAYQNYLGGGMLGSIQNSDTLRRQTLSVEEDVAKKLDAIGEALSRYFHSLTNHEDDEWENQSFEQNQSMPISAY